MNITVRPIRESDIDKIAAYWLNSSDEHLIGMGVDLDKLPESSQFTEMLLQQISLPVKERMTYALIWEADGEAIGHCNVNKIVFEEEAFVHLHIWKTSFRQKGVGLELFKQSINLFFGHLNLKRIYCEPYAHNPAPNKTLEKAGFQYLKTYTTIPGSINFEQEVNCWVITK